MLKFPKTIFSFFQRRKFFVKENGESFGIFLFPTWKSSNKSETRRFFTKPSSHIQLKDESECDTSVRFAVPLIMSYNVDKEK
jgi:hypothetical protein